MSPSPSNQSTKETHRKVMAVFAKYNTDGFALIPHTNRYARWLFKHVWLLPIILLFLLMVAIAIATGKADNRQEKFLTQTLFIATTTFVLPFFLSVAIV